MNLINSNNKYNIVFHVGYPKAASTTLQKHLFNKHPDLNNLGLYPTNNIGNDSKEIDSNCLYLNNNSIREFYRNLLHLENNKSREQYKNIVNLLDYDKVNLFSHESFTGVLFTPIKELTNKAELLNHFFPTAKILIIIRNQYKLIESQYRDHPFQPNLKKDGKPVGKPVSFSDWVKTIYEYDNWIGYLHSLKYDRIIKYYSDLFGESQIKVLLFEDFVNNLSLFSKELANFLEIGAEETESLLNSKHENIGISYRFNSYRKIKKRFPIIKIIEKLLIYPPLKEKYFMLLKSGKKAKYTLDGSAQAIIKDYFRVSNQQLLSNFPHLNIRGYGYPL